MTFPHKGYYIHINLLFEQKTNIFLNNYCYNHNTSVNFYRKIKS